MYFLITTTVKQYLPTLSNISCLSVLQPTKSMDFIGIFLYRIVSNVSFSCCSAFPSSTLFNKKAHSRDCQRGQLKGLPFFFLVL